MHKIAFLSIIFTVMIFTGCTQEYPIYIEKSIPKCKATKYTSAGRHKATMKDYTVKGKRYHPVSVALGDEMHGISSWYGPNFHGKLTSNGEVYDMYAKTAAHKTWPMDTIVRVKNLENGRSTVVRINDRGPFVDGRIIDCSYAAGKALGLDKLGIAKVDIRVIEFANLERSVENHHPKVLKKSKDNIFDMGLQIAAFKSRLSAESVKLGLKGKYPKYSPTIKTAKNIYGTTIYKVWLMGFRSKAEIDRFKQNPDAAGSFTVHN